MTKDDDFLRAMRGVEKLPQGVDRVTPAKPKRSPEGDRRPVPRFDVRTFGEQVEGLAPGVDSRRLRILRSSSGSVRVDLHGMSEAPARQATLAALERARDHEERTALIIHGRGRHSDGQPVLKSAVVEWLTSAPAGRWVVCFCSAPPSAGGAGATLVLLRPHRARRSRR
ncbi:MAG: Smr/MutS family protein [Acidobacteriota bacterium]